MKMVLELDTENTQEVIQVYCMAKALLDAKFGKKESKKNEEDNENSIIQ